jgi:hypothetical protein
MRVLACLLGLLVSACVEPALPSVDGGSVGDAGPYRCSAMNCTGCCSNNICRGGNEAEACGYDGRACTMCSGDTTCRAPGACVSTAHDGGSFGGAYNPDAGSGSVVENPLTGTPLDPPRHGCVFLFGIPICG